VKWNDLYLLLQERIGKDAFFGEETATVYCVGSGKYYPVAGYAAYDVCVAGDSDVVDTESLVIVIQNSNQGSLPISE